MTTEELAQEILAMIQDIRKKVDSFDAAMQEETIANFKWKLEDIEKLCKEQLKEQ